MPFFTYVYCCSFCPVLLFILFFLPSHPYQSVFVFRTFYHHLFCSLSFFLSYTVLFHSFHICPSFHLLCCHLLFLLLFFSLHLCSFFFIITSPLLSLFPFFPYFICLFHCSPSLFPLHSSFLVPSFLLFSSCHSLLPFCLLFLFTLLIVTYVVSSILPCLTFCLFPFVFLYSCPPSPSLSQFYYFFHLPFLPFLLFLPVHTFTSSFDFDLPSFFPSFLLLFFSFFFTFTYIIP